MSENIQKTSHNSQNLGRRIGRAIASFFEGLFRLCFFFAVGGGGYYGIELLVRGRSHWTMALAGGLCFVIIAALAVADRRFLTPPIKGFIIAVFITATELLFGIITRDIMKIRIWDYSNMSYNFQGYICLWYSLAWFASSFPFMWLARNLSRVLDAVFGTNRRRRLRQEA
jgi:hypothetical protein